MNNMYKQYPFNMFDSRYFQNPDTLQQQIQEQQRLFHQIEQKKYIADMKKAISDYIFAARKVSPEYQELAIKECFMELLMLMKPEDFGYKTNN